MGRVLVVDPSIAGISGDMLLSSLVSLGADQKTVENIGDAILRCVNGVSSISISFTDVVRGGVRAKKLNVDMTEEHIHRKGSELIRAIECVAEKVDLSREADKFAHNVLMTLIEAEAHTHGIGVDEVELHEIGSVDTIIDIVGTALALQGLNLYDAYTISMPVALGGGYTRFSHGTYPVPAPATIEILKKGRALVVGGFVEGELTTPTGAALLVNLVKRFDYRYPLFEMEAVGYGAGERNFDTIPNVLRVVTGKRDGELTDYKYEEIVVLETDVDDVTGEIVGHTFEKLLKSGAKDVSVIPIYMKKNRPGYTVRVIADTRNYMDLVRILIEETGTLGVKCIACSRVVVPNRELVPVELDIDGRREMVVLKISRDNRGNIVSIKPEYESVRDVSHRLGVPLRKVLSLLHKIVNEKRNVG